MKQKPVPSLAGIDGEPRVRQQAYTSYGAVQRTDGPESPAAARMRDGWCAAADATIYWMHPACSR
jgi:hypothetical protein